MTMTTRKTILLLIVLTFGTLLIYATASAARPVISNDVVLWDLTKTVVVSPGQTITIPADKTGFPGGVLTEGYILESKAKTKSGKLIPEGTFRLTMSVFTPAEDFGEQKAGLWYVQGEWTVIDKKADLDPQAKKSRHNPYKAEGRIHAALPFNPVERQVGWSAQATVPMSLAAGQWAQGTEGVLTLNSQLEGDLYLTLKLWPVMP
jgi:hypothetical protein